jgi:hypothetical protein
MASKTPQPQASDNLPRAASASVGPTFSPPLDSRAQTLMLPEVTLQLGQEITLQRGGGAPVSASTPAFRAPPPSSLVASVSSYSSSALPPCLLRNTYWMLTVCALARAGIPTSWRLLQGVTGPCLRPAVLSETTMLVCPFRKGRWRLR